MMYHDNNGYAAISNCCYYTENIVSISDYQLQPLAQKIKFYMKNTNHYLIKLKSLGKLPH